MGPGQPPNPRFPRDRIERSESFRLPARVAILGRVQRSLGNLPFSNDSNPGNVNQFIRSIQKGRFNADLANGFEFQANGTCKTDPGAKQIHDLLKGLIGMGRLSTLDNRLDLLKVYDSIDVQQQGNVVNVSANVPQDVVDKFLSTFVDGKKR